MRNFSRFRADKYPSPGLFLQLLVTLGAQTVPRCLTGPGYLPIALPRSRTQAAVVLWGAVHTHPAPSSRHPAVHSHSPKSAPGGGGLKL